MFWFFFFWEVFSLIISFWWWISEILYPYSKRQSFVICLMKFGWNRMQIKNNVLILCIMIASKKNDQAWTLFAVLPNTCFFHLLQIYRLKETDFAGIKRWKFRTAWKNMWYHDRQNKEETTNLNYGISLSNPETLKYQKRPIRWFLVEHLYHGGVKQQDGSPNWPFIVVTATIIPVISACTCTLCR